jgi:hypothetical protein
MAPGDKKQSGLNAGLFTVRQIALTNGGGAIQTLGEKLAANTATATRSRTIPTLTTSRRSEFYPKLPRSLAAAVDDIRQPRNQAASGRYVCPS